MKTFSSRVPLPSPPLSLAEPPKVYRFGDFELSTVPSRLTRGGRSLELQPQPARALELLLAHRGEIVTREMLRDHLWGRGTYLDHEQGINFALRKIRIALGDTPSAPRFVETVPRRGYRFIAPVEEVSNRTGAYNDCRSARRASSFSRCRSRPSRLKMRLR